MANDRLSPDEYDLNSEREHRLDLSASRSNDYAPDRPVVALKRYAESEADVLEAIALRCASAFRRETGGAE